VKKQNEEGAWTAVPKSPLLERDKYLGHIDAVAKRGREKTLAV